MSFPISTKNRFQIFQEREVKSDDNLDKVFDKMDKMDSFRQDFINAPVDKKLLVMFDELRVIRNEQISCKEGLVRFEKSLTGVGEKLGQVVQVTNSHTEFMKALAYRSIDMEARARRNNLIIRGITENRGENCFQLVRDFLANHLDLDPRRIYLARAHRLGRFDSSKQFQRRPIIVNFRDFCDIQCIMERVKMLRNSSFSVDYDFPREIQEARSRLWPLFKKAKEESPRDANIQIVYPAKLIKNGRLLKDELPEWSKYTNASRLEKLDSISFDSTVYEFEKSTQENCSTENNMQCDLPLCQGSSVNPETAAPVNSPVNTPQNPPNSQPQINPQQDAMNKLLLSSPLQLQQQIAQFNPYAGFYPQLVHGPMPPMPVFVGQPQSPTYTQTVQQPHVSCFGPPMETDSNSQMSNSQSHSVNSHDTQTQLHCNPPNSTCNINPVPVTVNENTIPKSVSPMRGRSRIARATPRSEKRSDSARPYKRNTSVSRSRSKTRVKSTTKSVNKPVCIDSNGDKLVFPPAVSQSPGTINNHSQEQNVSVLPKTINSSTNQDVQSEQKASQDEDPPPVQNVGH